MSWRERSHNTDLTHNLDSALDLQDLLERIRNGEISSDEALALYRQPAPIQLHEDAETSSSNSGNETVYFTSDWIASDSLPFASASAVSGPCVVFDTNEHLCSGLTAIEGISRVIVVKRGETYHEVDKDCFEINPAHKADYERLFESLKTQGVQPVSVLNLWPLENPNTQEQPHDSWFANALYPVFYTSQAILKQKPSARTLILHVFRHDNINQQALHAGVSGFARSLQLEHPHLVCRAVEVHPRKEASAAISAAEWVEVVQQELREPAADQAHVLYKQGERFFSGLAEINPGRQSSNEFDQTERCLPDYGRPGRARTDLCRAVRQGSAREAGAYRAQSVDRRAKALDSQPGTTRSGSGLLAS